MGAFNILRMLAATPDNPLAWVTKVFMIPFFTFHYGMFVMVHGIFVLQLFGGLHVRGFPTASMFWDAVRGAGRVMILHIVILVGGFLVMALGSPVLPLALLVVLKTALDLRGHLREHTAGPLAQAAAVS